MRFLIVMILWLPTKLEEQVTFMQKGNLAFSFTSYSLMDEEGNPLDIEVNAPKIVDYNISDWKYNDWLFNCDVR